MDLKRYLGKIQNKIKETKPKQEPKIVEEVEHKIVEEVEHKIVEEVDVNIKKTLNFVDSKKDPYEYLKRYLKEPKYKNWFNRNYPNYTIYDAVGLSISDYISVKRELFPESKTNNEEELNKKKKPVNTNFKPTITHETKTSFDEFIDERTLVSHNAFGNKEMKIKILEVSDEIAPLTTKFGDRVKINKIIVTIKHLQTQQIEEGEFDIESIESELIEKRHYTSTNRWVPTQDVRNGYVTNSRHTTLISDAVALDYIAF
uniref:Uncharacterized protein n=1 Tax=uncultured marine thaumarchaeote KM3_71_C08 TaxID=1456257 RepID=A0A075HGX1_9ARCH|nr:hypothetical protein [uncultured marine thaumarchaeote KM3_71_C08]